MDGARGTLCLNFIIHSEPDSFSNDSSEETSESESDAESLDIAEMLGYAKGLFPGRVVLVESESEEEEVEIITLN